MKKYFYIIAALAALSLVSCRKAEIAHTETEQPEVVSDAPVFYASFEGQDTKAGFTYDSSNKEYNHYWELGDIIYVIPSGVANDYPLEYRCTDASAGQFSYVGKYTDRGKYSGTPDKNYAVFGQCDRFNAGTKTFTFYSDGETLVTGADKNGAYGYSNQMVAASDDNNLTFKNTHGWLKLQLKGTQKVKSIDVRSLTASVPMTGEYYVSYDGTSTPAVDVSGIEEAWRCLTFVEPYVQLNKTTATDFYIALTPLTLYGIHVTVHFADGTSDVLQKGGAGSNVTIERNMVTPMAATTTAAPVVDLSAKVTSNCYIVNDAATTYRFRADVKGKSNESVGTPVKADILWTTQMSDEIMPSKNSVLENVLYLDGYVYFRTKDTYVKGNTVIAVRDADNNILWSWHIWSPGISDITTDVEDFSAKSEGLKFMKYDLGYVDGGGFPLFYQWGRKDPFIRQGIGLSGAPNTWPATAFSIVKKNSTVDNAAAHPATFFDNSSYTWHTPQNYQLWKDEEKTMYDPCPAGWRVQSYAELSKVLNYEGIGMYKTTSTGTIPGGSSAYVVGLGTLTGKYDGGVYKFWTTGGDEYFTSKAEINEYNGNLNVYSLSLHSGREFIMSNIGSVSSGHPVRCIAEK